MTYKQFRKILDSRRFVMSMDLTFEKVRRSLENIAKDNATKYPKVRTGNLYDSIKAVKQMRDSDMLLSIQAGNNQAFYAKFVEFGTKNQDGSIRMEPRFYLKRAYNRINDKMDDHLSRFLRLYLTRS